MLRSHLFKPLLACGEQLRIILGGVAWIEQTDVGLKVFLDMFPS